MTLEAVVVLGPTVASTNLLLLQLPYLTLREILQGQGPGGRLRGE